MHPDEEEQHRSVKFKTANGTFTYPIAAIARFLAVLATGFCFSLDLLYPSTTDLSNRVANAYSPNQFRQLRQVLQLDFQIVSLANRGAIGTILFI